MLPDTFQPFQPAQPSHFQIMGIHVPYDRTKMHNPSVLEDRLSCVCHKGADPGIGSTSITAWLQCPTGVDFFVSRPTVQPCMWRAGGFINKIPDQEITSSSLPKNLL